MLSIKALTSGSEDYYLHLACEDYYFNGGEPLGVWLGNGATILGLSGTVEQADLKALFRGFSPQDATRALVQNAGRHNRQAGWDLTFSAPKSVSVLWAAAERDVRQKIEAAHLEAVSKTVSYLEEKLGHSRIGKAGKKQVTARLIVAAFGHSTSRALDPQLHHHCLVLNLGVGPDGKTRSIVSKQFYESKMLLGALYRSELASQLRSRIRPPLERNENLVEVRGIKSALVEEFSTRRQEIKQELHRLGLKSAPAAAVANLTTRKPRQVVPARSELFRMWQATCQKHGLTRQAVKSLLKRGARQKFKNVGHELIAKATARITAEQSHFSEEELLLVVAQSKLSLGIGIAECRNQISKAIATGRIISLGKRHGQERFTTREMVQLEKLLLKTVDKLASARYRGLSNATVTRVITRKRDFTELPPKPGKKPIPIVRAAKAAKAALQQRRTPERFDVLSPEQANAIAHITQGPGRIKILTGLAGTSKTTTVSAIREAYEREGYRVIGTALSGKAAEELATRAGIETNTIRMRELQLHPTLRHRIRHIARQLYRAARYKTSSRLQRLRINRKTVLVVDEASMVGTKDMFMLAQAVERGGGTLVLVGDKDQLPSIEAGGPLGSIAKRIGGVHLVDILRQSYPQDREAVAWMPAGKAERALAHYADCGQLHVTKTGELLDRLIDDWTKAGGPDAPKEHIICTALNREVNALNDAAQDARMSRGLLNPSQRLTVIQKSESGTRSSESFYAGDRVVFTARSQMHRIENGTTGTLQAISKPPLGPKKISVLVDGETTPRVLPVKSFFAKQGVQFRRGYAFTTHKLQGGTAQNAYVALSGPMLSREMAYVELSRHKERLSLYTTKWLAGKSLTSRLRRIRAGEVAPARIEPKHVTSLLTERFSQSKAKDLAHDVIEEQQRDSTTRRYLSREEAYAQLRTYAESGNLLIAASDQQLMRKLIDDWQGLGGDAQPERHLLYALLKNDLDALNRTAQAERIKRGQLDQGQSVSLNGIKLYPGDQVCMTSHAPSHGLVQGQLATIAAISRRQLSLKLADQDKVVCLPLKNAPLTLGYALPTRHLVQSAPDDALVMLTDVCSDQQLSYVNQSLHTRTCKLYATREVAGPTIVARTKPCPESFRPSPTTSQSPEQIRNRKRLSMS